MAANHLDPSQPLSRSTAAGCRPQTLSRCADIRLFREVCASLNRECAALQGTRAVCATTPPQDHTPLLRELNAVAVPEMGALAGNSMHVAHCGISVHRPARCQRMVVRKERWPDHKRIFVRVAWRYKPLQERYK